MKKLVIILILIQIFLFILLPMNFLNGFRMYLGILGILISFGIVASYFLEFKKYNKKINKLEEEEKKYNKKLKELKDRNNEVHQNIGSVFLALKYIFKSQNEDEIYRSFFNALIKGTNISDFTLFMVDDNDKQLKVKYSYSSENKVKNAVLVKVGDNNVLGYVAERGEILSTLGLKRDKSLEGLFNKLPLKTLIAIPVKIENKVVGVLNIESFKDDDYTKEDLVMIEATTLFLGIALELYKLGYKF